MKKVIFSNAYYVKLGKKGEWEESSINQNMIRIGWLRQSLEDINQGKWHKIRKQLQKYQSNKGAVTTDLNSLRMIVESTGEDIWITFYLSYLWWCKVAENTIYENGISKYRKIKGAWKNTDVQGKELIINKLPGTLAKLQGFRGTACRVREKDGLRRLLNAEKSPQYQAIFQAKNDLSSKIKEGITKLHWKDFELIVDLIFRNTGWKRISLLGETMKYVDMELEEPITGDLYQIQIKSKASLSDFKDYENKFIKDTFRKMYFVVHSPNEDLLRYVNDNDNVELILPDRLSTMIVDLGLTEWLMNKIK